MKTIKISSAFSAEESVFFKVSKYNNGNLAVQIMAIDEDGFYIPFSNLTTNIVKLERNFACIDSNHLQGTNVVNRLERMGLIKNTKRVVASGYCFYEIYQFLDEFFKADFVVGEQE